MQPEELTHMIDLNCKAAVHMTAIVCRTLPKAPAFYKSVLLQLSADARLNVYAASKLSAAVQPGASMGTDRKTNLCNRSLPLLDQRYRIYRCCKDTDNPKAAHAVHHFPLASKTKSVVRLALLDNKLGLWVSTPGPVCFLHRLFCKIMPPVVAMGWWELIRRV